MSAEATMKSSRGCTVTGSGVMTPFTGTFAGSWRSASRRSRLWSVTSPLTRLLGALPSTTTTLPMSCSTMAEAASRTLASAETVKTSVLMTFPTFLQEYLKTIGFFRIMVFKNPLDACLKAQLDPPMHGPGRAACRGPHPSVRGRSGVRALSESGKQNGNACNPPPVEGERPVVAVRSAARQLSHVSELLALRLAGTGGAWPFPRDVPLRAAARALPALWLESAAPWRGRKVPGPCAGKGQNHKRTTI